MKNPGEYVDIGGPALQVRTDEDGNTVASATIQAVVLWKEDIKTTSWTKSSRCAKSTELRTCMC